jgi:hypothetical protein
VFLPVGARDEVKKSGSDDGYQPYLLGLCLALLCVLCSGYGLSSSQLF